MTTQIASEIMEELYNQGLYQRKKVLTEIKNTMRSEFQHRLQDEDSNYHVFQEQRVVAYYRKIPIYNTDYSGLKDFLANIGILPFVATFPLKGLNDEVKAMIEPFGEKVPSIGIHPNKAGRVQVEKRNFSVLDLPLLSETFYSVSEELSSLEKHYEDKKKLMLQCEELKEKKKITHEFGSISYSEKIGSYDVDAIFDNLGMNFLIEHANVDFEKLQAFFLKGFISKRDIEPFRTVTNYRNDFILQTIDSQEKMRQHLIDKREYLRTSSF